MRRFLSMVVLALLVTHLAYAQTSAVSQPSLEETLSWMKNFSTQHGFQYAQPDRPPVQSNQLVPGSVCDVSVEYKSLRTTVTDSTTKSVKLVFSLRSIDPQRIKTQNSSDTNEVAFEASDSSGKIRFQTELGSGRKIDGFVGQYTMFFDSTDSARRFAEAFKHAVTLCGGKAAPF